MRNGQDVWPFVERALANTLLLVAAAVSLSLLIGLVVGTISAVRQGSLWDYTSVGVSFLGISIPVFWLGLMLQLFFKGLREGTVVVRHGMRSALVPVTTQVAIDIGQLAGGLIVTERVFQYPGMGVLFLDSLEGGDYTILLPTVMIAAVFVFGMNLIADLLYGVLDPRVRLGRGRRVARRG